jgi:hypothetical protein
VLHGGTKAQRPTADRYVRCEIAMCSSEFREQRVRGVLATSIDCDESVDVLALLTQCCKRPRQPLRSVVGDDDGCHFVPARAGPGV